jgi:hypothetical protein
MIEFSFRPENMMNVLKETEKRLHELRTTIHNYDEWGNECPVELLNEYSFLVAIQSVAYSQYGEPFMNHLIESLNLSNED